MLDDPKVLAIAERAHPAPPYSKTVDFPSAFINENHRLWASAPEQPGSIKIEHAIKGSLTRACAAKIYELAYFAGGPTLDFGTNWGLSAFVAAQAIKDSGSEARVSTIDLEPTMTARSVDNFVRHRVGNIDAFTSDAAAWIQVAANAGRLFSFAFVDHHHAYDPVKAVCEQLDRVLKPGSYVGFHDFYDRRSYDPAHSGYAVPQACRDGLDKAFRYCGGSGAIGIFRFAG